MTSTRRFLALVACATFVQLPPAGLAVAFASEAGAVAATECPDAVDASAGRMNDGMDMSRNGDCIPSPCDERMPDGKCPRTLGCSAGAWLPPATLGAEAAPPITARFAGAPATALLSRAIAPEVPPPRA